MAGSIDSAEIKINAAIYHYSQFVTITISLGLRDVETLGEDSFKEQPIITNVCVKVCVRVCVCVQSMLN